MLYLILLVLLVFSIFWLGDLALTLKVVKHLGHEVEINPIMRLVLRGRGRFIYLFKAAELATFLYLIWYLSSFEGKIPFYILLVYILFYSLLVANNAHVYYQATHKESLIFKFIYLGLVLSILFFIYLNYMLYRDLDTSFNALGIANSKYADLYSKLEIQNKSTESELPKDFTQMLDELNLSIRR